MPIIDYRTAGESHGPMVLALIEGLPAGLRLDLECINQELRRRQGGFGRSTRQNMERDQVNIRSGLLRGVTIGAPLVAEVINADHRIDETPELTRPRPGHADFAGSIKWLTTDCRPVLERASARETAARVVAGAVARRLLDHLSIVVVGFVRQLGGVSAHIEPHGDLADLVRRRDLSEVYCPDPQATRDMVELIRNARRDGDTLGGVVQVIATGVPPGLGSCQRWQDKLDGRLMQAVGSIQAIKGVEIGAGFDAAQRPGSAVHDEMDYDAGRRKCNDLGFTRRSNHAGGLEGGMSNGQPIVIHAAMKPISTLAKGLDTVDLRSKQAARSAYERSDVCAVPACSVVAENVVAFELARACTEKFSSDTVEEFQHAYQAYLEHARNL